eukprot:6181717-Pleurochrysis_carterae.AAC.3
MRCGKGRFEDLYRRRTAWYFMAGCVNQAATRTNKEVERQSATSSIPGHFLSLPNIRFKTFSSQGSSSMTRLHTAELLASQTIVYRCVSQNYPHVALSNVLDRRYPPPLVRGRKSHERVHRSARTAEVSGQTYLQLAAAHVYQTFHAATSRDAD